jgi:mitochondrial cardiolipin hydrolase
VNTADLDQILNASLADRRVQTAEKKVLTEWAARHATDEGDRAVARSRAFALAKAGATGDHLQLLEWLEEVVRVFSRPSAVPVTAETGNAFFSPGTTCIQELLRQFNITKQTADVCVFTITDDRITDALLRAHARGVKVRVLTDDDKSHDLGSDIERLRAAGIPCKMDTGNLAHMHHKFALFDGKRLLTGSFNWTRSASEQNEENMIVTPDPVLGSAFQTRFETLWTKLRDA